MPFDLATAISRRIRPSIESAGGRFVRLIGGKWEDQRADFLVGELRIRVEIERGFIDLLFAARTDPGEWFRAAHVMLLIDGPCPEFGREPGQAIEQIEHLLVANLTALRDRFGIREYPATKRTLTEHLRRQPDSGRSGASRAELVVAKSRKGGGPRAK